MRGDEKGAARLYATFKVHKQHEVGKAPPERPIISGSVTENISESEINTGESLPANTILLLMWLVSTPTSYLHNASDPRDYLASRYA